MTMTLHMYNDRRSLMHNLTPAVNGAKVLYDDGNDATPHYHAGTIDNLLDLDEGRTESTVRFVYDGDANTITMHYVNPDAYTVDPYGEAVANIVKALESALDDGVSGAMNAREYSILEKVAKVLIAEDPAIEINPRIA